jgi:hypothetical protein
MTKIDLREILDSIDLSDGRRIVVLSWSGKKGIDITRNLYLVGVDGDLIWRVSSKFDTDAGPFTKIESYEDGNLSANRWDGGVYDIDMKTGFATPVAFKK